MNPIRTISTLIITVLFAIGCSRSPQFIEEEKLQFIITQALISDAILQTATAGKPAMDTVDIYTPILRREGYTIDDLRYTISQMAARKSSPLNNLFENIKTNIADIATKAEYRLRRMQQYDSCATSYTADTVYLRDTTITGKTGKYKIVIPQPKEGNYTLTFQYCSHSSYDIGQRMVKSVITGDSTLNTIENSNWINRSFSPKQHQQVIKVPRNGYDTLTVSFIDPTNTPKVSIKDTSYIQNIRLTYTSELDVARKQYLKSRTSLNTDTIFTTHYELIPHNQPDSLHSVLGPVITRRTNRP